MCLHLCSYVLGASLRAWMHILRISSPEQLFKHILRSNSRRITQRSLLLKGGGEAHGWLGGPPPPDLISSPCGDGMHRHKDQVSFFFFFPTVRLDQRTSLGFCVRLALFFFFNFFPRVSHKYVAWHGAFVLNAKNVVASMITRRCVKFPYVEFRFYMFNVGDDWLGSGRGF